MPEIVAPTNGMNAPEEDDHGERERERHAQDPEADADQRRVDRSDQRRAADEAAEDAPGVRGRRGRRGRAGSSGKSADDPRHSIAVRRGG